MIEHIIHKIAVQSPYEFQCLENKNESISFYKSGNLNYQRFFVVLKTELLSKPADINDKVQKSTPLELLETPTFAKNTDLVLLYKLDHLNELSQYEYNIFDIEENAYSLKKHVLYYTDKELGLLNQYLENEGNIESLVTNSEAFKYYKNNPEEESSFNLACRIFVKLPFLAVPTQEAVLSSASQIADKLLGEHDVLNFFYSIEKELDNGCNYEDVMEALINEEMANK